MTKSVKIFHSRISIDHRQVNRLRMIMNTQILSLHKTAYCKLSNTFHDILSTNSFVLQEFRREFEGEKTLKMTCSHSHTHNNTTLLYSYIKMQMHHIVHFKTCHLPVIRSSPAMQRQVVQKLHSSSKRCAKCWTHFRGLTDDAMNNSRFLYSLCALKSDSSSLIYVMLDPLHLQ